MGAPKSLHLFDVPSKKESIEHLEELATQFSKWMEGRPKKAVTRGARTEDADGKFNFVKSEPASDVDDDDEGEQDDSDSEADAEGSLDDGPPPSDVDEDEDKEEEEESDKPVRCGHTTHFEHISADLTSSRACAHAQNFDSQVDVMDAKMYEELPMTADGDFLSSSGPPCNQLAARPTPTGKSFLLYLIAYLLHSTTRHRFRAFRDPCKMRKTSMPPFCAFRETPKMRETSLPPFRAFLEIQKLRETSHVMSCISHTSSIVRRP